MCSRHGGFLWLPDMGVPPDSPDHPFIDGFSMIFHYKPSRTWGTTIYGNLHMGIHQQKHGENHGF
jgi:hypothetical protein